MLEHGGRLLRAAREYGIPLAKWLDLSTGISPYAWPVPPVPAAAWQRLPEDDDGLIEAARQYYQAPYMLPVAGSQAAIQALPYLRKTSRVGVIAPGYTEHAHAWRQRGHQVECVAAERLLADYTQRDVIVLIHPNNPGGERFDPQMLLNVHARLAARGGWLIVDEAFMDVTPALTLCPYADREGLIVLRSVGKFFGLAGARAGFVCAEPTLLEKLRIRLGPWALTGPTRYVLQQALADHLWQTKARLQLRVASAKLEMLLTKHALPPTGNGVLFQWCCHDNAVSLHRQLAARGVLTRVFDRPASLRFGLPGNDQSFARLDAALSEIRP